MIRDVYESANLGSYEQLFPCKQNEEKQAEYDKLLKASKKIFMQNDPRFGSKSKRRQNNMSANQPAQNKSNSPVKRERVFKPS